VKRFRTCDEGTGFRKDVNPILSATRGARGEENKNKKGSLSCVCVYVLPGIIFLFSFFKNVSITSFIWAKGDRSAPQHHVLI